MHMLYGHRMPFRRNQLQLVSAISIIVMGCGNPQGDAHGYFLDPNSIDNARGHVRTLKDSFVFPYFGERIVEALIESGDIRQALEMAEEVDRHSRRASIFGKVAAAYARVGDLEEARSVADKLESYHRIEADREIARALAEAGYPEKALEAIKEHGSCASMSVVARIIQAYSEKGEIEHARTLLSSMEWSQDRVRGLLHVESALWKKGEATEARDTLSEALDLSLLLDDLEAKVTLVTKIARRIAVHGDTESGIDLLLSAATSARKINDPWSQAMAFSTISATANELGCEQTERAKFDTSVTTARGIERLSVRALSLTGIAEDRFAAGRHDEGRTLMTEALATVRAIGEREERTLVYSAMAQAHAHVGDLSTARTILLEARASARRIRDIHERAGDLATIELCRFQIRNQLLRNQFDQ